MHAAVFDQPCATALSSLARARGERRLRLCRRQYVLDVSAWAYTCIYVYIHINIYVLDVSAWAYKCICVYMCIHIFCIHARSPTLERHRMYLVIYVYARSPAPACRPGERKASATTTSPQQSLGSECINIIKSPQQSLGSEDIYRLVREPDKSVEHSYSTWSNSKQISRVPHLGVQT